MAECPKEAYKSVPGSQVKMLIAAYSLNLKSCAWICKVKKTKTRKL
jgi:hypothetical protein